MPWDDSLTRLKNVLADLYPREDDSRDVARSAGLNESNIHFSSRAKTNWSEIVSEAAKQGRVINVIRSALEENPRNNDLLDILGNAHTPVRPLVSDDFAWKSSESPQTFEKLMGRQSTLLPVSWLELGAQRARPVAKVILSDNTYGSGFLIRDNFFLTNNHVLPTSDTARTAIALFNYQQHVSGRMCEPVNVDLDPDTGFATSIEHDWTFVRVKGDANASWGALALEPITFNVEDHANIIQHPEGRPKQIACYHNIITSVDEVHVQYLTDTLEGSSGSAVFDNQWRLIALHHKGGEIVETGPKKVVYPNQGININCIVKDLERLKL